MPVISSAIPCYIRSFPRSIPTFKRSTTATSSLKSCVQNPKSKEIIPTAILISLCLWIGSTSARPICEPNSKKHIPWRRVNIWTSCAKKMPYRFWRRIITPSRTLPSNAAIAARVILFRCSRKTRGFLRWNTKKNFWSEPHTFSFAKEKVSKKKAKQKTFIKNWTHHKRFFVRDVSNIFYLNGEFLQG